MQFNKTELVDAEQIVFSDADKAAAKKYIPTTAYGSTVKYDADSDTYLVLVKKIGKMAKEGDWLVTDSKKVTTLVSGDDFHKIYTAVAMPAEEPETVSETPDVPEVAETPEVEPEVLPEIPIAAETPAVPDVPSAEPTHEQP